MFRISGQNYHRFGSLLPADGQQSEFAQLYIYDTHNEVCNRMKPFMHSCKETVVDEKVVRALINMFYESNVIEHAFRMAKNRFKESGFVSMKLRLIAEYQKNNILMIISSVHG